MLSPQKWIKSTNAIGITSKSGRYGGGTFAHKDIAFEFASWISPEFKLFIIKDYQRLKESESHQLALDWNVKRILSKANYRIHTDAIKEHLIPPDLSAKQWREQNPDKKGNIRDEATIAQLTVLTNLESLNAFLVQQGLDQKKRISILREQAISQLNRLADLKSIERLNELHNQIGLPIKKNKL